MRSIPVLGLFLLVTGCGSDGTTSPIGPAGSVTLAATSAEALASTGDTRAITAVVRNATGAVISPDGLTWRSSDPSIATVDGTGATATVTAVDDGTANIIATIGGVEGTIPVTVQRKGVAIAVSAPDTVVVAGGTMQLGVHGFDARQHPITGLTGVSFASSEPMRVVVSPTGLVTGLFSAFPPLASDITATLTSDGATLSATKHIGVGNPAPAAFDLVALLLPEAVRPEPAAGLGQGVIYLTARGARIDYKLLWSAISGPPLSAHIHGPDLADAVADLLVDLPLGTQQNSFGVVTGSFSAADIRSRSGEPAITLDSLRTLLGNSAAYIDVHTAQFGAGEMRGRGIRVSRIAADRAHRDPPAQGAADQ
jgi:hypothetical protein